MILRIKEIMKERGMRIGTLAQKVDITQPNMSNIVNGKSEPSLKTLGKIADALEVHITELFAKDNGVVCPHCGKFVPLETKVVSIANPDNNTEE